MEAKGLNLDMESIMEVYFSSREDYDHINLVARVINLREGFRIVKVVV